jgi:hypothetical protein
MWFPVISYTKSKIKVIPKSDIGCVNIEPIGPVPRS